MKCLSIADIELLASFDFPVVHDYPPHYAPFLDAAGSKVIPIHFSKAPLKAFQPDGKPHANLDSWDYYRRDQHRYIVHTGGPDGTVLWQACLPDSLDQIEVSCSDILDRGSETWNPLQYPMDQILWINLMTQLQSLLIHGAGLHWKERGWIFSGRSGAGKSTLAKQFMDTNNGHLLSDDRIIIRTENTGFSMWGTPWVGDASVGENTSRPLNAIYFIQQSKENRIEKLSARSALERLFVVVSNPVYDRELVEKNLEVLDQLVHQIPMYDLFCRDDTSVVDFLTTNGHE